MFKKGNVVKVYSNRFDWGWEGVGMIIEKPKNSPDGVELVLSTSDGIQEISWNYDDRNEWGWYVDLVA